MMTTRRFTKAGSRRGTAVIGGLGAILVGTMVVVPSAGAGGISVSGTTTTRAGYLDKSFAGGEGFRFIPSPAWAGTKPKVYPPKVDALALVIAGSDARTVTQYWQYGRNAPYECAPGSRAQLQGWTSAGLVDRDFANGRPVCADLDPRTWALGAGFTVVGTPSGGMRTLTQISASRNLIQSWNSAGRRTGAFSVPLADRSSTGAELVKAPNAILRPDASGAQCVQSGYQPSSATTALARWSSAGKALSQVTLGLPNCWAYGSDASGRSFIAGVKVTGTTAQLKVARLTVSGSPDSRFGTGGVATVDIAVLQGSRTARVLVAPDGSGGVYVGVEEHATTQSCESCYRSFNTRLAIARFDASGKPVAGFGSGVVRIGPGTTVLPQEAASLIAMVADSKGPIISVGDRYPTHQYHWTDSPFHLIRLRAADGSADPAWGSNGVVRTTDPSVQLAYAPDRRLLALNGGDDVTLGLRAGCYNRGPGRERPLTPWTTTACGKPVKLVKRLT